MTSKYRQLNRRQFIQALGATAMGVTGLAAFPGFAHAQGRKNALLIGLDIGDSITFDPARLAQYSSPMTVHNAYDTLVTMTPGDYINLKPNLATSWEYRPDGKAIRFKLLKGAKFASGNPVTAEDVKWSIERVINLKDQPAQYIAHVDKVEIVSPDTIDIVMKDPTQPLLTILAAPSFSIMDSKLLTSQGGTAAADAKDADKATTWLNGNSGGSAPWTFTAWERNQQIQLARNPNYRGEKPGYERVVIRHMSESAAQLLALKRGDIDIAFNLIPEQIATLKGDPQIEIIGTPSLDFIYMAVAAERRSESGAGEEAEPPRDRLRDRLRRHHQLADRRFGGAAGELPAGRRQRLDGGDDQADRLPAGPGQGEEAARRGRQSRRLRVRAHLFEQCDRRCLVPEPRAEAAGATWRASASRRT